MKDISNKLIENGIQFEYTCSNGIEQIESDEIKIQVSTQKKWIYFDHGHEYRESEETVENYSIVLKMIEDIITNR